MPGDAALDAALRGSPATPELGVAAPEPAASSSRRRPPRHRPPRTRCAQSRRHAARRPSPATRGRCARPHAAATDGAAEARAAPRFEERREAAPNPLWAWLVGGNTLARVGVLLLFIGVGFLLKYAVEHVHVPIEVRLAGVALGGVALLVVGWRLRVRAARLRDGAAGWRRRRAVPDGVRGAAALRAGAAGRGVRAAVLDLGAVVVARDPPGRDLARRARRPRRISRADPDVDRQRQSRDCCSATTRCSTPASSASPGSRRGVAQPARFRVHVRRRHVLGRHALPAGALRDHRAVPDPVLPLLRRDRRALRAAPVGRGAQLRRRRDSSSARRWSRRACRARSCATSSTGWR